MNNIQIRRWLSPSIHPSSRIHPSIHPSSRIHQAGSIQPDPSIHPSIHSSTLQKLFVSTVYQHWCRVDAESIQSWNKVVYQLCINSDPLMDGWMDGWMDGRMDGWMDGVHFCKNFSYRLCINFDAKFIRSRYKVVYQLCIIFVSTVCIDCISTLMRSWCGVDTKIDTILCINFVSIFCIDCVSTSMRSSYEVDTKLAQTCVSTVYKLCINFLYRLCINIDAKFIRSRYKVGTD